jgi:hypothetical protein
MSRGTLNEAVRILSFALHFICLIQENLSYNGFTVVQTEDHAATVASIYDISDFRNVEYSNKVSLQNMINYCADASCGVCSQIQNDPCQVRALFDVCIAFSEGN